MQTLIFQFLINSWCLNKKKLNLLNILEYNFVIYNQFFSEKNEFYWALFLYWLFFFCLYLIFVPLTFIKIFWQLDPETDFAFILESIRKCLFFLFNFLFIFSLNLKSIWAEKSWTYNIFTRSIQMSLENWVLSFIMFVNTVLQRK